MWDILFNEGGDRDKLGRGWIWQEELLSAYIKIMCLEPDYFQMMCRINLYPGLGTHMVRSISSRKGNKQQTLHQ